MTLGERILLKRKEAGMSQENLGNKLDVSRQTVYKWENDQATPELDKLIAMAKIFNVKVGWLIAEEESEQSNIAYDQIVDKVTEVYSKGERSAKPKSNTTLLTSIGSFSLLLFFTVFYTTKMISLEHKYNYLDRQIENNQIYMQREISQISNNVQNALDNFNNITLNSEVSIKEFDFENDCIILDINAQPKVYTNGMSTVFHVTSGGQTVDYPATENNQNFYAVAKAQLMSDVTISVEFISGNVSETRNLVTFSNLTEDTWPFYDIVWSMQLATNDSNTAFDDNYCEVINYGYISRYEGHEMPKIVSEEMFLTENGTKIVDYIYDEAYHGNMNHQPETSGMDNPPKFMFFRRPDNLKLNPKKIYEEHLLITDEYGRYMEVVNTENGLETSYYIKEK